MLWCGYLSQFRTSPRSLIVQIVDVSIHRLTNGCVGTWEYGWNQAKMVGWMRKDDTLSGDHRSRGLTLPACASPIQTSRRTRPEHKSGGHERRTWLARQFGGSNPSRAYSYARGQQPITYGRVYGWMDGKVDRWFLFCTIGAGSNGAVVGSSLFSVCVYISYS